MATPPGYLTLKQSEKPAQIDPESIASPTVETSTARREAGAVWDN
jgi:hypothetical protein